MKPYSIDLRQRIVNAVRNDENTPDEAATRFNVCRSTVYNLLQLDQDLQNLTPQKSTGRKRRIPSEQEPTLQVQVDQNPDDTLEMHCQRWKQTAGVTVSVACMHNSILRLAITLKKNEARQRTQRRSQK